MFSKLLIVHTMSGVLEVADFYVGRLHKSLSFLSGRSFPHNQIRITGFTEDPSS
jgi:hypothetical protein